MAVEILECEQGSDEWRRARAGIPTASAFSTVMAKGEGKTRSKYMRQLAGEIITGEPMENYSNHHMERGKLMEDEARALYVLESGNDCYRVGFIRNGQKGCSPDSIIGVDGGVEIKTALPDILIDLLLKDEFPPEHKAQTQGFLWVAEREWIDIIVYWPKMPPLIKRATRDNGYIANLAGEVDRFNDDLAKMVETLRRLG